MDVRDALGREIAGTHTMRDALSAVQRVFVQTVLPN
jgi:hypothetical protein